MTTLRAYPFLKQIFTISLYLCLTLGQLNAADSLHQEVRDLATKAMASLPDSMLILAKEAVVLAQQQDDPAVLGMAEETLAKGYYFNQLLDSAIASNERALGHFLAANDSANIANQYNLKGAFLVRATKYEEAAKALNQALEIALPIRDTLTITLVHTNLGNIANYQGVDSTALKHYFRALYLSELSKDSMRMCDLTNNIGLIQNSQGQTEEAIKSYQSSIEIAEKMGHKEVALYAMQNLGSLYWQEKKNEQAIEILKEAEQIALSEQRQRLLIHIRLELGAAHEGMGSIQAARKAYRQALDHSRRANNSHTTTVALNNLGHLETYHGQPSYGLALLEEAQELGEEINWSNLSNLYENLGHAHLQLGHIEEGIAFFEKGAARKDSLKNVETSEQIAKLQVAFDTEKKDRKIQELIQQKEIDQLKIQRQWTQIIALLLIVGMVVVCALLLMQRNQLQHRQRLNQQRLEQQETELKSIINTQEQERDRFARDLHDGLGQLMAAVRMQLSESNSQPSQQGKVLGLVDQAVEEIRTISHTMMPRILQQGETGLAAAIEEMLEKTLTSSELHYSFTQLGTLPPLSDAVRIGVYRIAQELVSNVIRHASASHLEILLSGQGNTLTLMVEDDGIGISPDREDLGMGLANIETRAKAIGGIFQIEAGPEKGTVASIRIPF